MQLIRSTDSVVLSSNRALLEYSRPVRKISSFTSRQYYQENLQEKSNNLLHSGSMTEFVHQNKCPRPLLTNKTRLTNLILFCHFQGANKYSVIFIARPELTVYQSFNYFENQYLYRGSPLPAHSISADSQHSVFPGALLTLISLVLRN